MEREGQRSKSLDYRTFSGSVAGLKIFERAASHEKSGQNAEMLGAIAAEAEWLASVLDERPSVR